MSRSERRARNRRAHAIRRAYTEADYRAAREAGQALTWRQVWDTYAAMSTADVLALEVETAAPVAAVPAVPVTGSSKPSKRRAPAHVQEAAEAYRLARQAWEVGLSEALRGANPDGRPARGERYTDEERDYRDAHPAPTYREFLTDAAAARRAAREAADIAA